MVVQPLFPVLRRARVFVLTICASSGFPLPAAQESEAPLRFDLGAARARPGYVAVHADMEYSRDRGFGFEPGFPVRAVGHPVDVGAEGDFITADGAFYFSVAVPEGNHRVRVMLGDAGGTSETTVKAELRRLMLERVRTEHGAIAEREFIVNVRVPQIAGGGAVRLKAPRETTQEAWAWDDRLTLEFNGSAPKVCAIEIEPVDLPTVFLLGDSTVCDQSREPFNSWGQMLTRFFKPGVAIANHGESGETYRDSIGRGRLDKVVSVMQPGDHLIVQFGHNDQKQLAAGTGGPSTTYQAEMRRHVAAARTAGGIPILVTPMNRRSFEGAAIVNALGDYPDAVRQVAAEENVPLIDLHAMSRVLYEALGPEGCVAAFAAPGGVIDNTHHSAYGSYLLAKCIAQGIRDGGLPLARHLVDDLPPFDPAKPDPLEAFAVPPSPLVTNTTPLGN